MKIRNGFVSNSSSSSFVIIKQGLTDEQKYAITNHLELAIKMAKDRGVVKDDWGYEYYGCVNFHDGWNVSETKYLYFLDTSMANFDLDIFLQKEFNIPEKNFDLISDGYFFFFSNDIPQHILDYDEKLRIEERVEKLKRII